tara:strand:- start:3396 stop:3638 length:243 start_codon:yes stop_codon:yes gene_type:complete
MTVYFDRTKVKTPEEIQQQQNIEAVGAIVNFFAKPAILWGTWNLVIPSLFGLPPIGYLQSLGLYVISRILFDKNETKVNS